MDYELISIYLDIKRNKMKYDSKNTVIIALEYVELYDMIFYVELYIMIFFLSK